MLVVVGMIGTLNPSSGDVSVFLPTEQALLPATVSDANRTALFARYALIGSLLGAFGALGAGVPEWLGHRPAGPRSARSGSRSSLYAALALVVLVRYRSLSPGDRTDGSGPAHAPRPSHARSCTGSPRCSASTRSVAGS